MIDKGICDKAFNWYPRDCECDKSCDLGEHLNYKNCKCKKKLVDKTVEECSENFEEKKLHLNKIIYNSTLNDFEKICSYCTIYIVLFFIFLIRSISISSVYIQTAIYWMQFN